MSLKEWQISRSQNPKMAHYRNLFKNSKRLLSDLPLLKGKHVIIYFEQGIGDTIMLLRYLDYLNDAQQVTVLCSPALHSLVQHIWKNVNVLDKFTNNVPEHDFHILSLDLPDIIHKFNLKPYISVTDDISDISIYDSPRVGIAWEGNPGNVGNGRRSCPLKYFKSLKGTLFSLQKTMHLDELREQCDDMDVYSVEINDFIDVAKLINSVDYVVSVDTSVMHLAASMGKKTYGLLSAQCDPRWGTKEKRSIWYPSLTLVRQHDNGDWQSCFDALNEIISG